MPALSFSGKTKRGYFYELILARVKTQTCRRPRKNPIKEGDDLTLYWKQRVPPEEKPIHKIGEAVCTKVETLPYHVFAWDDEFARKDGFEDHVELQEWFGDPYDYTDEEYDVIYVDLLREGKQTTLEGCGQMTCVVCGLPIVDEEDKKFAKDQEAHPGILGNVHRSCYQKESDEHPELPWEDPISGEIDWEGMEEDLGVDTGYDEYEDW